MLGAYHQLWQIEKSFRMSESDLRARPIYHHKRESIEAHLSIVMAALAVGRIVEQATDWSISRFVKTLRPCRTITVRARRTDHHRRRPNPRRRPGCARPAARQASALNGKSQV